MRFCETAPNITCLCDSSKERGGILLNLIGEPLRKKDQQGVKLEHTSRPVPDGSIIWIGDKCGAQEFSKEELQIPHSVTTWEIIKNELPQFHTMCMPLLNGENRSPYGPRARHGLIMM